MHVNKCNKIISTTHTHMKLLQLTSFQLHSPQIIFQPHLRFHLPGFLSRIRYVRDIRRRRGTRTSKSPHMKSSICTIIYQMLQLNKQKHFRCRKLILSHISSFLFLSTATMSRLITEPTQDEKFFSVFIQRQKRCSLCMVYTVLSNGKSSW